MRLYSIVLDIRKGGWLYPWLCGYDIEETTTGTGTPIIFITRIRHKWNRLIPRHCNHTIQLLDTFIRGIRQSTSSKQKLCSPQEPPDSSQQREHAEDSTKSKATQDRPTPVSSTNNSPQVHETPSLYSHSTTNVVVTVRPSRPSPAKTCEPLRSFQQHV